MDRIEQIRIRIGSDRIEQIRFFFDVNEKISIKESFLRIGSRKAKKPICVATAPSHAPCTCDCTHLFIAFTQQKQEMAAAKKTCPICCEDVTSNKQFITCPHCDTEVCAKCVKQYVKTVSNEDIACMCCNKTWTRSFIFRNLPHSIVHTTIKDQRTDALFDKEKALLPYTMTTILPLIEQKAKLTEAKKELQIQIKLASIKLQDIMADLDDVDIALRRTMAPGGAAAAPVTDDTAAAVEKEKVPKPIMCCPQNDCRGYILDIGHECGLCHIKICKDCHKTLPAEGDEGAEQHVCKEEDKETVAFIKRDAKACPNCHTLCKKMDGCDQVWCIVCKTAWKWSTRTIDKGAIHTPDYFAYMRNNNIDIPRRGGDGGGACVGLQGFTRVFYQQPNNKEMSRLLNIYRRVAELDRVFDNEEAPVRANNVDLRILYLKNEITETKWKQSLHARDKKFVFESEIHNMKRSYVQVMRELIGMWTLNPTDENIVKNIYKFSDMMTDEFNVLASCFKSKRGNPFMV